MKHSLLIPFLDKSARYCRGVELGMQIIAPMLRGKRVIRGYFRTENEEQIRLAAHRMGYDVNELKPWKFEKKHTGWVWMKLVRREINHEQYADPNTRSDSDVQDRTDNRRDSRR